MQTCRKDTPPVAPRPPGEQCDESAGGVSPLFGNTHAPGRPAGQPGRGATRLCRAAGGTAGTSPRGHFSLLPAAAVQALQGDQGPLVALAGFLGVGQDDLPRVVPSAAVRRPWRR